MRESRFRAQVLSLIEGQLDGQATPIETVDTAGAGIPDVELCLPGGPQAWLELKVAIYRPRTGTCDLCHFRRLQARWLRDRWRLGGACGLLIRCEAAQGKVVGHLLLDGEDAARVFVDRDWRWATLAAMSYLPEGDLSGEALRTALYAMQVSVQTQQGAGR